MRFQKWIKRRMRSGESVVGFEESDGQVLIEMAGESIYGFGVGFEAAFVVV